MSSDLKPGDPVIVRDDIPTGHCRTPHYLRGRRGKVVSILSTFPNPEQIAYYQKGEPKVLYEVRFASTDIWSDYDGSPKDAILADIYDHWLEPANG